MREPILGVATGQKGVGKTHKTKEVILQYVKGNAQKKPRKVLIYDVNMEYTQFQAIALKDLRRFTLSNRIEVRRVLPRMEDGTMADIDQMMEIMNQILNSFAGGLLVLEDINRYMIGTQTTDIIGTIATNRHRDLDIMIHLQSLSAMTPRMWQNTSVIRFHKQADSIDRYIQRIPNFEIMKIAQIMVNEQYKKKNIRFFCYVSSDEGSIRGEFSNRSFKQACEIYAETYPQRLNLVLKRVEAKGSEKRNAALKIVTNELYDDYNGNIK